MLKWEMGAREEDGREARREEARAQEKDREEAKDRVEKEGRDVGTAATQGTEEATAQNIQYLGSSRAYPLSRSEQRGRRVRMMTGQTTKKTTGATGS